MKIIIWGIGVNADYIYDTLLPGCEVVALVDVDSKKQNSVWKNNLTIKGPEVINQMAYDYIIVTPQSYSSIERQIAQMDIEEDKVIYYWKDEAAQDIFEGRGRRLLEEIKSKKVYRARLDSAPYEWGLKRVPVIESAQELLNVICREGKSLSRFGDGEFEIMRGNNRPWFQIKNEELAWRLMEIFQNNDERVLVAAAQNFINLDVYKERDADIIRIYMEGKTRQEIINFFNPARKYYDAYVSRPYIIYRSSQNAKVIFSLFKKIWTNRNVIMVEGKYGRTGIGNDLFSCAQSVKRIVCPATNAWNVYKEILQSVIQHAKKEDLICISLGPTASVLAYDLAMNGIQALDIGQLDNEYEWYLRMAQERKPIKGKMVAEVYKRYERDDNIDIQYMREVICIIQNVESE